MKTYSFHVFIAREATLRVAAKALPMANLEKLRFGLALMHYTDEVAQALRAGRPSVPLSIELERLDRAAAEWAAVASKRGMIGYVEAEVTEGAGWHAGVSFAEGRMAYGPLRFEDREAVRTVLAHLGVKSDPGLDEVSTLKLDGEN